MIFIPDPRERPVTGRLQIGTVAGFKSESPAGFVGIRSLTTLPLIGGGVTLIGNPTKAAEPVTRHLLDCYDTWLFYERRFLRFERFGSSDTDWGYDQRYVLTDRRAATRPTPISSSAS